MMIEQNPWENTEQLHQTIRTAVNEDRRRDISFSLGKDIPGKTLPEKRQWIYAFLRHHKCFEEYGKISDVIKRMKLSTNKLKDQVVIECVRDGQPDEMYNKLCMIPARTEADPRYGISNLEVYANRPHETQVYISWVCASIDIEKHLVNGFLSNYRQVNRHFPMKDSEGVETFEHCFMMKACDLMKNPPPNFVWLGKKKLRVRYRGQVATCFICDSPDHLVHDCPKKKKREIDNQKTFNLNNKVDYPGLESNEEKGKEGHPVQKNEENKENEEVVEVEERKEIEQEDTDEEGKTDEQSSDDVINHH